MQGNLHALAPLDALARGCVKPLSLSGLSGLGALLTILAARSSCRPIPARASPTGRHTRRCTRPASSATRTDSPSSTTASSRPRKGQAAYYAFTPKPGLRLIALNTVAEGDVIDSNGNLDSPQFRWLTREIEAAERRDELIVVYGHHPIASLNNRAPDEDAGDCALRAVTGPGCDLDPRDSKPLRFGADLQACCSPIRTSSPRRRSHAREPDHGDQARRAQAGGFWEIETASEIDWPIQSRLIELMDNRDGTLSIFGTLIDHAASVGTPAPGTPRQRLRAPTRSPPWRASSPTTTRRSAWRTAPRGARRTATSSCCSTTRAPAERPARRVRAGDADHPARGGASGRRPRL